MNPKCETCGAVNHDLANYCAWCGDSLGPVAQLRKRIIELESIIDMFVAEHSWACQEWKDLPECAALFADAARRKK